MPSSKFILCIAEDPIVRQTKRMVLERVGFNVTSIENVAEAERESSRSKFDLVVVGRSVTREHKGEIASIVRRNLPNTPILEMCDQSPEIAKVDYALHSHNPEDLTEIVKAILHVGRGVRAAETKG
jgi:DNA-binding NtrC family response regulator